MNRMIIYSLPWGTSMLFNVIKQMFNRLEKLVTIGAKSKASFLDIMDADAWPKSYGGNVDDELYQDERGSYWPPKNLGKAAMTMKDYIRRDLEVFSAVGDQEDCRLFTTWTPFSNQKKEFEDSKK